MPRREDLTTPRQRRRLGVHYDPDAFGQFSEGIARYLGTARYLVFQSALVVVWVAWNLVTPKQLQFDPWSGRFVFLTLALSLQAAYAAPLILLAQNRQEFRDRQQIREDRTVAARTQADTEFLAREIAGVRLALADVITTDDLDKRIEGLADRMDQLLHRLDALDDRPPPEAATG
jgi:uncharacterized membrane protein